MVDRCKARGAQSEITTFAPAGRRTFHDSVVSHTASGPWHLDMHIVIQDPSPSVPTQSRATALQEMPRISFRFNDKKELYVKSFAKTSARKGHFHCQPLLFFLKDLLDPRRLFWRLQLTTCGAVFHFSHPSRMPKLS